MISLMAKIQIIFLILYKKYERILLFTYFHSKNKDQNN